MDLVSLLASQSEQHPSRVVLTDCDQHISMRELWQRVCTLADTLRLAGVQNGDRIALVGGNSPAWVEAYLAAMAAGAVAVPLNPELRSRDLVALIRHAGAHFAFVDVNERQADELLVQLPEMVWITRKSGFAANAISLDALAGTTPASRPYGHATDLACILYTSGTTGAPKGVMLGHDNVLQNAEDVSDYLELRPGDTSLALLPFYYSFGNSILITHLLRGCRLVFGASLMYPEKMLALVAQNKVTGLYGVPSLFQMLLKRDLFRDPRWASLRYLAQAGGALMPAFINRIRQQLPRCKLFVMYGQTEATARIAYLPAEYIEARPGSVGWPMPDTCIQVRDERGNTLPAGQVGLIWVRGPGVMRGYWKNPAATAEVLHDDWLNTGDMGELDAQGFLYIRGRRSDMLKVSGQRLHPQEVEAVVCELPQVSECAVDGIDDPVAGQVPRAFVVLKPGQELTEMELLRHCRSQLAGWKVPRRVEVIEALPKTGSGKVQRHRLAETLATTTAKGGTQERHA